MSYNKETDKGTACESCRCACESCEPCKCETPCESCKCEATEPEMSKEEWLAAQSPEVQAEIQKYEDKCIEVRDFKYKISEGKESIEDMHMLRTINDKFVVWTDYLYKGILSFDLFINEQIAEAKKGKNVELVLDTNQIIYLQTILNNNLCGVGVEAAKKMALYEERLKTLKLYIGEAFESIRKLDNEVGEINTRISMLLSGMTTEEIEAGLALQNEPLDENYNEMDSAPVVAAVESQLVLVDSITGEKHYFDIEKFEHSAFSISSDSPSTDSCDK